MTNQSNAAAERSVHIIRGGREVLAACPVVQLPGGKWQLKAIVERDAEIEKLRAERRAMQGALFAIKAHTKAIDGALGHACADIRALKGEGDE
jgi:hypothetical protein